MRVKIGSSVYDSGDQPIMLILTDEEKQLITNMIPTDERFCSFPDGMNPTKIKEWMMED